MYGHVGKMVVSEAGEKLPIKKGIGLLISAMKARLPMTLLQDRGLVSAQWDDDGDGTLFGWSTVASDPEPEPTPEVETEPTPDPEPTPEVETEPTPEPEPDCAEVETEPTPEPEPAPVLLAPVDGYVITDNTPEYQWEETEGAFQYQLNVIQSNGDDMILEWYEVGTDVICADGICTLNPEVALPNDTYEWIVRPWEDDFASWYASFIFTVDAVDAPLPDPVPLPEDEELNEFAVR